MKLRTYDVRVDWTGNDGVGTRSYREYRRDHTITGDGKPEIPGSSDPSFRGDRSRFNPEELLVASLSACHMLWYLHLCAVNHVRVMDYRDCAQGVMEEDATGVGQFVSVMLRPIVKIADGDSAEMARGLHENAHRLCYIARSVNFPVEIRAEIVRATAA
jgi:organic hydroperoxide reductase OsmC/OhrA